MNLPVLLHDGPENAELTIALAHGAGAPMDSDFMQVFARRLSENGFHVVRFEFPYMAERRQTGKKRPPNRAPILLETWNKVIEHLGPEHLIIGGKSMGGRIASMVTQEHEQTGNPLLGLVCLGYPFHPPGKPEKLRVEHLKTLKTPALFCQGTRDTLGTKEDVAAYSLSETIRIHWLEDGDHSFKPRKKSGFSEDGNRQAAIAAISEFAGALAP